jgi:hypothetical protein
MLDAGEDPNENNTDYAIARIKEGRVRTTMANLMERDAARRRKLHQTIRDDVRYNSMPSFSLDGLRNPGGKNNWSVGGIGPNLHERKQ